MFITGRMTTGRVLVDLRGAYRMCRLLIVRNDLYASGGEIERYEGGVVAGRLAVYSVGGKASYLSFESFWASG